MRRVSLFVFGVLLLALDASAVAADRFSGVVVLSEAGFPAADAADPAMQSLTAFLPGAHFVPAGQLATLLTDPATRLLVLPYGSAFPEESWTGIFAFLQGGGNLLVLGRAAIYSLRLS